MIKSLFDKAKSMIVEDVPEVTKHVEKTFTRPMPKLNIVSGTQVGQVDLAVGKLPADELALPKVEELRELVQPTTGPLFIFNSTLASLQAAIPNEATRFKTTAQVLTAQGISIAAVTGEAEAVLTRIKENEAQFLEVRSQKIETEVNERQRAITALEEQIAKLAGEKEILQNKLTESEENIKQKTWQWESARGILTEEYTDLTKKLNIYFEPKQQGATK